jgi:hypothetical protein
MVIAAIQMLRAPIAALIHAACYLRATPLFQKEIGRKLQALLSSLNEDAIQVRWGSAGR